MGRYPSSAVIHAPPSSSSLHRPTAFRPFTPSTDRPGAARRRKQWFATQESALRSHIAEFETHNLVRMRPAIDGQPCYYCVLPGNTMEQIIAAGPPP